MHPCKSGSEQLPHTYAGQYMIECVSTGENTEKGGGGGDWK